MRPDLARYTDRGDDGLEEINERGPKEMLWVSFITVYLFWLTSFFQTLIQKNPHIGFQAAMRTDTVAKQAIMGHIRTKLNQRRCAIKGRVCLHYLVQFLAWITSVDRNITWRKNRKDRWCTATPRHTSTHAVNNSNPQVCEGQGVVWALRARCISGKLFLARDLFYADMVTHQRNAFQIAQAGDKDYWFVVDMELFQTRRLSQAKQDK